MGSLVPLLQHQNYNSLWWLCCPNLLFRVGLRPRGSRGLEKTQGLSLRTLLWGLEDPALGREGFGSLRGGRRGEDESACLHCSMLAQGRTHVGRQ